MMSRICLVNRVGAAGKMYCYKGCGSGMTVKILCGNDLIAWAARSTIRGKKLHEDRTVCSKSCDGYKQQQENALFHFHSPFHEIAIRVTGIFRYCQNRSIPRSSNLKILSLYHKKGIIMKRGIKVLLKVWNNHNKTNYTTRMVFMFVTFFYTANIRMEDVFCIYQHWWYCWEIPSHLIFLRMFQEFSL